MFVSFQKVTLFTIPFAGGSSFSYNRFHPHYPDVLDVRHLELPGRGTRHFEPLINTIDSLVDDMYELIKNQLDGPYIVFGHSMGSIIAYLLVRKIVDNRKRMPLHLFVSGRKAPCVADIQYADQFSDADLKQLIVENGGTSREITESKEAMDFFLPILRSDLQVLDSFQYKKLPVIDVPITVLMGSGDKFSKEEAMLWQQETRHEVDLKIFPGGHFFIFDHCKEIMEIISGVALPHHIVVL